MAFKIAITNFENGNEKTACMTLPADVKTIADTIEKAGIREETILRIYCCEKFPELVDADFDGKPTLDELNILAEKLEKVAESDLDIAAYRGLLRDGIYTVRGAICCALNTNTVAVYRCKDFEEYGKLAMSDLLFGEFNDVPYKANGDVDYEKIGQIEHEKSGGYFIGDYYVITETYFDEIGFDEKKRSRNRILPKKKIILRWEVFHEIPNKMRRFGDIMSRKNHETDYAAALENDYARWDELFTKGGSDPFWSDGVSLNLIRNHILFYKNQLAEQGNTLLGLPEVYYREIPPEVDPNYMARPDEIRENARKAMEIIDADENLKFVREQFPSLSEQQIKQYCLPAIINYAENLRRAIAEDDLIIMRRYEHPEHYLESFESAAIKIRNPESTRRINDNLTVCDPKDDEDIEDDFDEECSEMEQDDGEEISESASEPEEDFQLRLF